jgi:hypothetical protein
MRIYYELTDTCYMFQPLMWTTSGRGFTKNKYIEMLQSNVNQRTCKILNIEITWFKIRNTV